MFLERERPRGRAGRLMPADPKIYAHLPYVIELDGHFCGQLTIGTVTHGALRSAWIGYWVSSAVTGRGIATGALALGLDHCFGPVTLHRVEATVRPENVASRAVRAKAGFREEGILRAAALHTDGWHDMHQHARLADQVPAPRRVNPHR